MSEPLINAIYAAYESSDTKEQFEAIVKPVIAADLEHAKDEARKLERSLVIREAINVVEAWSRNPTDIVDAIRTLDPSPEALEKYIADCIDEVTPGSMSPSIMHLLESQAQQLAAARVEAYERCAAYWELYGSKPDMLSVGHCIYRDWAKAELESQVSEAKERK